MEGKGERKMKILFINACARENSRTLELCKYFLENYEKNHRHIEIEQVSLFGRTDLKPMTEETLKEREELIAKRDWEDSKMMYALQFHEAEKIVIGAPYWDCSFPSMLKVYIENIMVSKLNFLYQEDRYVGLCRGKKMLYISTAGGDAERNMGFDYIRKVLKMLGNYQCKYVHADNLDVQGVNIEEIMQKTKTKLDETVKRW